LISGEREVLRDQPVTAGRPLFRAAPVRESIGGIGGAADPFSWRDEHAVFVDEIGLTKSRHLRRGRSRRVCARDVRPCAVADDDRRRWRSIQPSSSSPR
jgi:hypothetical protein